jgi:hypothetical protein
MDAKLTGEKLNEERAFIKRYTDGLASHKVEYPDDFLTPLSDRPRKVAPVQVSYFKIKVDKLMYLGGRGRPTRDDGYRCYCSRYVLISRSYATSALNRSPSLSQ